MKKNIYLLLVLLISITITNCSTEDENKIDETSSIIEKFDNNQKTFVNKHSKSTDLSLRLNYSDKNKKINKIVLAKKSLKDKSGLSDKNELNHNLNRFDKHFVQNILYSLTEDDILTFFNRMEFYQEFVNNNISDFHHKKYLIDNIEGFMWIKYSLYELKNTDNSYNSKNSFDACFDGCMEDSISNALDDANWIDWAIFLATAAETTAGWTASCAWDCF